MDAGQMFQTGKLGQAFSRWCDLGHIFQWESPITGRTVQEGLVLLEEELIIEPWARGSSGGAGW